MTASRLRNATSPYLQQHAGNPVDWWPWCRRGARTRTTRGQTYPAVDRLLGRHWCHVMAHESFEDPETAAVMNALYVNIKVDREERPDLDKIYQTAHQLLARRPGGWPLTLFLTPDDHSAFFAGTYFPPQPRHGLLAFHELLRQVERAYREQRAAITEQNASLRDALQQLDVTPAGGEPHDAPLIEAVRQLSDSSMRNSAGSAGHPSSRTPPRCGFCCARGGGATTRSRAIWRFTRWSRWPTGGSMTTWAAGSAAIRSMPGG